MADWKDALASLQVPQAEDQTEEAAATTEEKKGVQSERLDIVFERKGRGGKQATIVTGFVVEDAEVEEVAAQLKRRLGTGGSARGGEILIQGDRRESVKRLLTEMGYKARII